MDLFRGLVLLSTPIWTVSSMEDIKVNTIIIKEIYYLMKKPTPDNLIYIWWQSLCLNTSLTTY